MRSDARKRLQAAREEGCGAEGGVVSGDGAAYREQAEALIADLRAQVSHVEAERDEQISKVLRLDAEFQALAEQARAADRAYEDLWMSYTAALRCIDDERQLRLAATRLTPPASEPTS